MDLSQREECKVQLRTKNIFVLYLHFIYILFIFFIYFLSYFFYLCLTAGPFTYFCSVC